MKKLNILAAVALAALAAGACSVKETPVIDQTPSQEGKVVTLVATLGPKGGADVKALTDPGDGTLSSNWVVNEELLVHYISNDGVNDNDAYAKATVTSVTAGVATITVDLVSPKEGNSTIDIYYPYSQAFGDVDAYFDQKGTLADISANYDVCDGSGTMTVSGGTATLPTGVTMTRQYCIWKFSFTDGANDITSDITSLEVYDGLVGVPYTITPTTALDAIYVAMCATNDATIAIKATTASGTYTTNKSHVTLDAGKFYRSSSLKLTPDNSYRSYTSGAAFTDVAIGSATPITSGMTTWAGGTYVVANNVTINGDVTMTGDVNLILMDGVELEVIGCIFGGKDGEGYPNYAYSLNIYGQGMSSGKLTIRSNYANEYDFIGNNMEVHGGIISATNAIQAIETGGTFVMYHGFVTADGSIDGIIAMYNSGTAATIYGGTINASSSTNYGTAIHTTGGGLTISGGSVTATNTGANSGIEVNGNLTVSGGVVTATGGEGQTAINIIGGTISLSGVTMYEGDSPNPADEAASQTACTKRYVIIQ